MKYVRTLGDFPILEIDIEETKKIDSDRLTYYYPDGIEIGFPGFKKTYFVSFKQVFSEEEEYYKTPEDALENYRESYVKDGYIWSLGKVTVTIENINTKVIMTYKDPRELNLLLENLFFKLSCPLSNYICFETPKLETLYEYKEKTLGNT